MRNSQFRKLNELIHDAKREQTILVGFKLRIDKLLKLTNAIIELAYSIAENSGNEES